MRLRNIPGADEHLEQSPFVIDEPVRFRGCFKEQLFKNDHPVYVEIGCGKGSFINTLARLHPENNYIGIEKMSSVLLRAVQKAEAQEEAPSNLFFMRFDAERITELFAEGEISGIYLNFSDPWPKDRHHKRRLTSREFLKRYEAVLSPGGSVEFKTDNTALFDFSLEEAESTGWEITLLTRDLHHSPYKEGNIMTEYEDRFVTLGNRIMKLVMKPGEDR